MHPARAARVAILHAWGNTQTEGWWRQAFDVYGIPYDYIDPDTIGKTADLRSKWDVIVAGPGLSQAIVDGQPMWNPAPTPYKHSEDCPTSARGPRPTTSGRACSSKASCICATSSGVAASSWPPRRARTRS